MIDEKHLAGKALGTAARVAGTLQIEAQIEHSGEVKLGNTRQIGIAGTMMLPRAPQDAPPQPPAPAHRIAAIIAKIMHAFELDYARILRHNSLASAIPASLVPDID
jgi:hypothetical protein